MGLRNAIIGQRRTQARLNRNYELEIKQNVEASASKVDTSPTAENLLNYNKIKAQLERHNAIKTEECRIRSKAIHIEDNERCTQYFLNPAKTKVKLINISKLTLDNKTTIMDHKSIRNQHKYFYDNVQNAILKDCDFDYLFLNNNSTNIMEL